MAINSTYLSTSTTDIYTSSGETAAMTFYFSNYSTSANVTFSLWAVKSGQLASNLNVLYSNVAVQAGDTYVMDIERIFLDNGDSLRAYCSANNSMSATLTYSQV